jgi:hypothetical protein
MGLLALILPGGTDGFALDEDAAARLAGLGVTRVSLLRDEEAVAVVLEGWAFDPEQSSDEVQIALLGRAGSARVLRDLAQVNLTGGAARGG